jgi:hypothetical protein
VSTGVSWHFNRVRLAEALSLWKATGPDAYTRAQVNEALMDLIKDPLLWGSEDPQSPGVFHREIVTGTGVRIGILYAIPSLEEREVAVADIRSSISGGERSR